jgi:hypothetical protein
MDEQARQIVKFAQDWAAAELRGDTAYFGRVLADASSLHLTASLTSTR